ncbi:MAG: PKD domain-containing protein [Acidobacteriota bacterium]
MGAIRSTAAVFLILISAAAASAADCVTGTRVVSTRDDIPNLVVGPSAWTGSGLVVAKTQAGALGPAWVSIYGDAMETLAGDRQVANDARDLIALSWTGAEAGLVYRSTGQQIRLLRLSPMGDPIGSPITITPNRPVFSGDKIEVVWSAFLDAYVVAHNVTQGSARGLYVTMLEENGTQRSDRPVLVSLTPGSPLAVDVTDAGVIGVFFNSVSSFLSFARMTGSSDTPEVRELVSALGEDLLVAADGEQFVVVRGVPDGSRKVIRWLVVNTGYQVTRADAALVAGSGEDALPQALVVTPDEIALSYIDSPIRTDLLDDVFRLRRFTIDGTLLGDTLFSPVDVGASRAVSEFPFAWTGTGYLSPAVRESTDRLTSYLIRYCPLRVAILAPRKILVGETITFVPEPSGGVPGYTYVWMFSHQAAPEKNTVTPQRTYTAPGTYSATVTVKDTSGVSTSATVTFDVVYPRRRAVRP